MLQKAGGPANTAIPEAVPVVCSERIFGVVQRPGGAVGHSGPKTRNHSPIVTAAVTESRRDTGEMTLSSRICERSGASEIPLFFSLCYLLRQTEARITSCFCLQTCSCRSPVSRRVSACKHALVDDRVGCKTQSCDW